MKSPTEAVLYMLIVTITYNASILGWKVTLIDYKRIELSKKKTDMTKLDHNLDKLINALCGGLQLILYNNQLNY